MKSNFIISEKTTNLLQITDKYNWRRFKFWKFLFKTVTDLAVSSMFECHAQSHAVLLRSLFLWISALVSVHSHATVVAFRVITRFWKSLYEYSGNQLKIHQDLLTARLLPGVGLTVTALDWEIISCRKSKMRSYPNDNCDIP